MKSVKIISILILFFVFIIGTTSFSFKDGDDYWLKKCKDGYDKCGFVDRSGKYRIAPGKFDMIYTDTFRKIAIVVDSRGLIAINRANEKLFDVYVFDNGPDPESEGLFRIDINNKLGYADMSGVVVQPAYDGEFPFKDGLASVNIGCVSKADNIGEHYTWVGGKWGCINKKGEVVIPLIYDKWIEFDNGEANVSLNGKKIVIDTKGKYLRDQ